MAWCNRTRRAHIPRCVLAWCSALISHCQRSLHTGCFRVQKKKKKTFTHFCFICCLTGPYLLLSGCMLHLVTQHTAVTRQTPVAKSHPFRSNTLHLVPVEHLRNLIATHPAAVGFEWSTHVCDPFLPVFLVNRQASFSASSLSLLTGMCTPSVGVLRVF